MPIFTGTMLVVLFLAAFSIVRSKRLADFLDALSDERVGWSAKCEVLREAIRVRARR